MCRHSLAVLISVWGILAFGTAFAGDNDAPKLFVELRAMSGCPALEPRDACVAMALDVPPDRKRDVAVKMLAPGPDPSSPSTYHLKVQGLLKDGKRQTYVLIYESF